MRNRIARTRQSWTVRRRGGPGDGGMTLVELIVTMLVIAIVMTLSSMLIVSVDQQSSSMLDTVKGIEAATGAEQSFVQYLQGSTQLLGLYNSSGTQIGPSANEMDMVVNDGFSTAAGGVGNVNNWGNNEPYTSNCTNLDAIWEVPAATAATSTTTTIPEPDAQFTVTSDLPSTGPPSMSPWSPWDGSGPFTFSPASPCSPPVSGTQCGACRSVSNYYALEGQTDPEFTYWKWTTSSVVSATSVAPNYPPGLVQLPLVNKVLPQCAISEVAAVGVHVTFLAGPQQPREGYAADQPTTVNTLVFLIGSTTSGATTSTTTTSTSSTCTE